MFGWQHFLIAICGCVGILLGGVLMDLDHTGNLACKWKYFWGQKITEKDYTPDGKAMCETGADKIITRGIIHEPVVFYSIFLFLICLAIAMMTHFLADHIYRIAS